MKRLLFSCLLLCGALIATAGIGIGHVKGDLNCDGEVDVTDINMMINIMLGRQTLAEVAADVLEPIELDVNADGVIDEVDGMRLCDLTGDGKVDVADMNKLINYAIGH